MKKNTKIVIIIVAVLAVAMVILALANREAIIDKTIAQETATISIVKDGEELLTVGVEDILAMPAQSFKSLERSSGDGSQVLYYTGVELKDFLTACQISLDGIETVVVRGADGYVSALTAKELNMEENAYLVYALDGQSLGSKKDGGRGPYQLVLVQDVFAQRWCKFVMEIEING